MRIPQTIGLRALLTLAVMALPAVLLFSSVRTLHEIDIQRTIYLRHRVALLAARLENVPPEASPQTIVEMLSRDEPNLIDLQVILRGTPADDASLAPIWEGRELFRTGMASAGGSRIFRALVPFHSGGVVRIARIELDPAAADFLVVHARHNVIVSSVSGLVLVVLSVVALWAVRRAERLRQQQMAMEHMAHIGKMSAVLAHEIRNPLGTIKGFVQLAGESAEQRTKDLLRPALAEMQRLEALVNDLLAYGRPPDPQMTAVPWNRIAGEIAAHGRHMIGERPIRFSVTNAAFDVQTDPALLGQALLNLVRNAVEAIPAAQPGEVRIEASACEGGGMSIVVADDGPGIPEGVMARLFEPFHTTKASGTGLGLAITRKLVQSLGGSLEVRRGQRCGTEAEIHLG